MAAPCSTQEATSWLLEYVPRAAPSWLHRQRWFGGKAHPVASVDVEDIFWLPEGDPLAALVSILVRPGPAPECSSQRYVLLLGCCGEPATEPLGYFAGRPIADMAAQQTVLLALLSGLSTAATVPGVRGGRLAFADSSAHSRRLVAADGRGAPTVTPIGADQSNTSARVGSAHVFKLFRRLDVGQHPEIEIGRFLRRAGFRHVPPLEGSITCELAGGGVGAIGALEGWIENTGDGWRDLVTGLDRTVCDVPALDEVAGRVSVLGALTAEFHLAMASDAEDPAFAPELVTVDDHHAWQAAVHGQLGRALAMIKSQAGTWPEPAASLGQGILALQRRLAERVRRLGPPATDSHCAKIRIHGDFHLGQTLRTDGGFAIIDFEGEPSKPLTERRRKHSALKDVAGMLRSFDYAVATVRTGSTETAWAAVVDRLRTTFVDAYRARASAGDASFLPATRHAVDAWIRFFEFDKALYEVEYEASHRPSWVHIPLAAVAQQLTPSRAEARGRR